MIAFRCRRKTLATASDHPRDNERKILLIVRNGVASEEVIASEWPVQLLILRKVKIKEKKGLVHKWSLVTKGLGITVISHLILRFSAYILGQKFNII